MQQRGASQNLTIISIRRAWARLVMVALVALVCQACGGGGGGGEEPSTDEDAPIEAIPADPLALKSMSSCALDSDCAAGLYCFIGYCASECQQNSDCTGSQTCTDRGRCRADFSTAEGALESAEFDADFDALEVVKLPEITFRVDAGQSDVTFRLDLNAAAPDSGVPYRLERAEDSAESAKVFRAEGGEDFLEIPIPVGFSDPELEDSEVSRVTVVTPIGDFNLQLYPATPVSGEYSGVARLNTFGATGLPLEFQVVTKPNGAPLQDAEQAWLVLPVGPQFLFSPVRGASAPEYVARPLEYDDFVERWVATFTGSFDLSDGDVIANENPDQVRRSLRFEMEQFDSQTLRGEFNDRWNGLYESRSADGVTRPKELLYEGEFEATRTAKALTHQELETEPVPAGDPQLLPAPAIDGCDQGGFFSIATESPEDPVDPDNPGEDDPSGPENPNDPGDPADPNDPGDPADPNDPSDPADPNDPSDPADPNDPNDPADPAPYHCDAIASADDFVQADPAAQASCALAVADAALQGDTTIAIVEAYLNGDDVPSNDNFEEFIEKCAAGTDGTCQPTPQVICARQLVARAYDAQGQNSTQLDVLVDRYNRVTKEAFFGKQVAAFGSDTALRLDWLESSVWPETFSGITDLVADTLETWKTKVLEAQLATLKGQFDPSGLAVMSRQVEEAGAADAREQLLVNMTQNWRGSIDALTLATQRWNELFTSDAPRAEKTAYVSARIFDLYLSAGILRNLNTSADAGYLSARLAGGFDILLDEVGKLSLPFSDLIYARDGEVVLNTSLDPENSNDTIIGDSRAAAMQQIDEAQTEVAEVLAKARAEKLNREQLANKMDNQIDEARTRLVHLCGRPVGCEDVNYLSTPPQGCETRVEAGKCGFQIDRDTDAIGGFEVGQQNVSEAGRVMLELIEATKQVSIADADRRAQIQRVQLRWEELQEFASDIEDWNAQRSTYLTQLQTNIDSRQEARTAEVQELYDSLEQRAAIQQERVDTAKSNFAKWENIASEGAAERLNYAISALALQEGARGASYTAGEIDRQAESVIDGMPVVAGTSADPTFAARLATSMASNGAISVLEAGAMAAENIAAGLEYKKEQLQAAEDTQLTNLSNDYEIQKTKWTQDIAELKRQAQINSALTDQEVDNLKDAAEILRQTLESELAYSRDLAEFRRRRTEVMEMVTKTWGLSLRKEQAKLQVRQVMARYHDVVQRAHIGQAQLNKYVSQRTDVNALVGSPGVLFARANELEAAERALGGAKRKLMNWLVALEYYAVRPFVDQRQQILLARSPYELEQIADDLDELQRTCGGPTNAVTTTLSVRKDLLGITKSMVDPVSGTTISPTERFNSILSRGYVPTDKRVRYSSNETVGRLMARNPAILSGTFFIDLSDFANLELTCNAKVKSMAINLVGEGLGPASPSVTVLYDGTSELRSCQPGIADYVDLIGSTATTYGPISRFSATGQSMSPVADVNGFGEASQSASTTLAGLPLSSQYTVLINKSAGENGAIDWTKLEDIELRLTYSYQDVFSLGQCEL